MPRKVGNSTKAHQQLLREQMRGYGCTVAQIAAEMSRRYNLRPRTAWRHALGWAQWKVAQQYNTHHPGYKLADNRVSEYETWPHGGTKPSLRYFARLATTYGHGCTPAHLVDAEDLAHLTPADRCFLTTGHPTTQIPTTPTEPQHQNTPVITLSAPQSGGELILPTSPTLWTPTTGHLPLPDDLTVLLVNCLTTLTAPEDDTLLTPHGGDRVYHRLVQLLTRWAHTMKRRLMLRSLGWAATAASVGHLIDPDEQARVMTVLNNPSRLDTATLEHFEAVLWHCQRQDDTLGPRGVLETVLIQRQLLHPLLADCPATLQPRLLSTLSNASRHAGWLSFDLNDFDSAGYYYEDARLRAHEAQNIELCAFVLCQMSHSATWQNKPHIGLDHAVAAQQWANRTGDTRLRAYTADVAARAYAADGQHEACLSALDTAHSALPAAGDQTPSYAYFYDEALHISIRGGCHLTLRESERATGYAQQSLATLDPSLTRNTALTIVDLARAYAQSHEVDEAARLLGNAGDIAAHNSSTRLIEVLQQGRADLQPWANATAVRELDDRLRHHGLLLA
ncbi:MAG: hypothetical protein ACRDTC_08710 [Pseudonocardiaceae bacterium]